MFKCIEGCLECCKVQPFPQEFVKKHKKNFQVDPTEILDSGEVMVVLTDDRLCVFLDRKAKECSIFKNNPEKCRLHDLFTGKKLICHKENKHGNNNTKKNKSN